MKKTYRLKYKIIFLSMLVSIAAYAGEQVERKKLVEKNYKVSRTTKLALENKFGDVKINSWDKAEFTIKVEIIGKGKNEDRAQRILDAIEIDIVRSETEVIFESQVDNLKNKNGEGFEINYTVYMPESNPLEVRNSFGDITMGDRKNDLDVSVSYGSLKAGDVSGDSEIKVSFGSGSVGMLSDGDLAIKYSTIELDGADKLDLTQGFSNVEIGTVEDLELESKYGKLEIEKVNILDAKANFSGFEIDELTGSMELDCSYLGNFRIRKLAKTFTSVDIDGRFGSYEIDLEEGLQAMIDAEFSFADLRYSSEVDIDFRYRVKESNKNTYRGSIGGGDPNKEIRIESRYGNLSLGID